MKPSVETSIIYIFMSTFNMVQVLDSVLFVFLSYFNISQLSKLPFLYVFVNLQYGPSARTFIICAFVSPFNRATCYTLYL